MKKIFGDKPASTPFNWGDVALCGLIIGLALAYRATNLDHFITADEHNWVYRSALFLQALLTQDWPGTSLWLTPGVTTTWLGALALWPYYLLHQADIAEPLTVWLGSFSRNKIELPILVTMRWTMAGFTALMSGLLYLLARRLWSRPVALGGSLLLLAEAHLLAVSRIIGHDAPVTYFMAAALLAFMLAQPAEGQAFRYGWLVFSAVMMGFAVLSKTISLFLLPFMAAMAGVWFWLRPDSAARKFKIWVITLSVWAGVAWLTFVLFWPAAWVSPLGQTWAVIENAFLSSIGLEDADIQPFWEVPQLGWSYYLVNGAFKLSPVVFVGLGLALVQLIRQGWQMRRESQWWRSLLRSEAVWLLLFGVGFGLFMSFGVKRSPRYILPAFPALAFLAAMSWLAILPRRWEKIGFTGLVMVSLGLTSLYAPYYFTYFNPLLGGPLTAPQTVRLGWGEGLDEVARWLNQQATAPADQLGARYTATIFPFYEGSIASPSRSESDYVAFYIKQSQSGLPRPEILRYFEAQGALHRVTLAGVDYAQIYAGPAMELVSEFNRADFEEVFDEAGEVAETMPANQPNMPLAFRPASIYAQPGLPFTVTVLWPADHLRTAGRTHFTLTLQSETDPSLSWQSAAPVTETAPGLILSQHHFELPADLARQTLFLEAHLQAHLQDKAQPFGSVKVRTMTPPAEFAPLETLFSGQVKLIGYQQDHQNDSLDLTLAWQGWREAANDFTVFVQILNSAGERVAGVDVQPQPGFTELERKEVWLTRYQVPLSDLPPGEYQILVGLYYFAGADIITVGSQTLPTPLLVE